MNTANYTGKWHLRALAIFLLDANTVKPLYIERVDNWFLKIYLLK
jgi:hypothetical protein